MTRHRLSLCESEKKYSQRSFRAKREGIGRVESLLLLALSNKQRNRVISHFPVKLLGSDAFPSDASCS